MFQDTPIPVAEPTGPVTGLKVAFSFAARSNFMSVLAFFRLHGQSSTKNENEKIQETEHSVGTPEN